MNTRKIIIIILLSITLISLYTLYSYYNQMEPVNEFVDYLVVLFPCALLLLLLLSFVVKAEKGKLWKIITSIIASAIAGCFAWYRYFNELSKWLEESEKKYTNDLYIAIGILVSTIAILAFIGDSKKAKPATRLQWPQR